MQSPFARRKARKIGQDGEDEPEKQTPDTPLVRSTVSSRSSSSKSKKRSSLRTSTGPGGTSMNDEEDEASPAVFVPKKSNLSRQAIEKNALRKSIQPKISSELLPARQELDQPSYSANVLKELKASTPSTPKDLRSKSDTPNPENESDELELASKFGTDLAIHHSSAIPTVTEIQEKKARRARLAKEREFISLDSDGEAEDNDPDDSDSGSSSNHETSILPYTGPKRPKGGPSRTAQDEDEFGEGFDEFVSDGRIALGKKAERQQRQQKKEAMKSMIEDAQASDSASESDSDAERRNAYEAAQTRAGMDGLRKAREMEIRPTRPRTPPRITPLPTMGGVLEKLRERKQARDFERKLQEKQLEGVRGELRDIEARKVEVQRLMREAGERFERLRAEVEAERKGEGGGGELMMAEKGGLGSGMGTNAATTGRGLESLGTV